MAMNRSKRTDGKSGAVALPSLEVLHQEFVADYDAGLLFWREVRYPRKDKPIGTSSGRTPHLSVDYKRQKYKVHRILWAMYHGADPGDLVIDHIDGNAANNAINNLRACTLHQNSVSVTGLKRGNKSGWRGVYWRKDNNSWAANVPIGKRKRDEKAGFKCPTSAAIWAHQRRLEAYGEFAGACR